IHLQFPSSRCCWLGRLPVPLDLQHQRLRTPHRQSPPASPYPSDVRGSRLRRALIRPAKPRLSPPSHTRTLQSQQHRQRRNTILRQRRLWQPQRNRNRLLHSTQERSPPWTPTRRDRSEPRKRLTNELAIMVETKRPLR